MDIALGATTFDGVAHISEIRALLLTRYDRLGPSSRVRMMQYCKALGERGIQVTTAPLLSDSYLRRVYAGKPRKPGGLVSSYVQRLKQMLRSSEYDVIWLEKEALPGLPAWLEELLLRKPVILDVDDAWHFRYSRSLNPWLRYALGHKLEHVARSAFAVTVANSFMYGWAKTAGAKSVYLIPTVIDLERYQVVAPPGDPFTVGWIGTPSTKPYLDQIGSALQRTLSAPNSRLLTIGLEGFSLPGVRVDAYPWTEEHEARLLQQIHVGVMPLTAGSWEGAKSAYKAVQYMASGRPVIASPVGAALSLIQEGITGFYAHTEESWIQAIESLRNDRQLLTDMGKAARRQIEEHYTLQSQLPALTSIFKSAAGRDPDSS